MEPQPQPLPDGPVRCGVDVVSIDRIARLLGEFDGSFRERVYTPAERRYCGEQADPPQHYAARWAAKEAFLKAVGTEAATVPLNEVGVERRGEMPTLALSGRARAAATAAVGADGERVGTAVSLSHDRHADCAAGQVLVFDRAVGSGAANADDGGRG